MANDGLIFGPAPWLVASIGAKHSGKSEVIKYVCRAYAGVFSKIVVFCPTALNGYYDTFLPKHAIHDDYDPAVMREIIARQEAYKRAGKVVHVLIVMDDILGSQTIDFERRKQNELSTVWAANRHFNISCIVVTQSLKKIPPLLRHNVDWALIHRVMREAYAGLYETFGHTDKATFYKFLDENTRDYRVVLFKANVKDPADHFRVFHLPKSEISRRFTLLFPA